MISAFFLGYVQFYNCSLLKLSLFDKKEIFSFCWTKLFKLCSLGYEGVTRYFTRKKKICVLISFGMLHLQSLHEGDWHLQCDYLRSSAIRKPLNFVQQVL